MKDVAVIRTGTANLASVLAGLRRAQCKPVLVDDPKMVTSADYVVLPGVGAFAAIMDQLRSRRHSSPPQANFFSFLVLTERFLSVLLNII